MAKKVYAVRVGRTTGIFDNWNECAASVNGYSGAEYKSFSSKDEARGYLNGDDYPVPAEMRIPKNEQSVIAYVDGSYDSKTERYSYGCVIIKPDGSEVLESNALDDPVGVASHNVSGELQGALFAANWAIENGFSHIDIYHDLEGTSKWASGEWKANVQITKEYVGRMKELQEQITINFHQVKGHSNNHYNDVADSLARRALKGKKGRSSASGECWFKADGISHEELSTVIDIVMEEGQQIQKHEEDMPYFKRIIMTEQKDKVTIHHYTTKDSLMVQGKPNRLFSSIITYLNELVDLGDTSEVYSSNFNVDIEQRQVVEQTKIYLPHCYDVIPKKMLRVLHQAVLHTHIHGDFFECSFLVYPALRALEGHLKFALKEQGLIEDVSSITSAGFEVFTKTPNGLRFVLKPESFGGLSGQMRDYLGRCYTFFSNNRHTLFHWDDPTVLDTTTVIESVNDAHNRIRNTLTLIDEYYNIA